MVAEMLHGWIRCVLQASRPWISTRDIDRGSIWFTEIAEEIKHASIGIICLTQSNKERPWLLFEAGALAKGLSQSRVCPFLIDIASKDVAGPLAQFHHTLPEKDSVRALISSLNRHFERGLDSEVLDRVFETYWPQFETDFASAAATAETDVAATPPRNSDEILAEILANTRHLAQRVGLLETGNPVRFQNNAVEGPNPLPDLTSNPRVPAMMAEALRLFGQGLPRKTVFDRMRKKFPNQSVIVCDLVVSTALSERARARVFAETKPPETLDAEGEA